MTVPDNDHSGRARGRDVRSVATTVVLFWLPIVVYVGVIFSLSSISQVPFRFPFRHCDKLLHGAEYGFLALLIARAFCSLNRTRSWWIIIVVTVVCCTALGALDEFYQSGVPNRDSDVMDVLMDGIGGLLGGLLYFAARVFFQRGGVAPDTEKSD